MGNVYLLVLTSGLHVPISLMRMSQSVFLGQDSFANCDVLKLTLCVCVWYRCRSDRRQRKCSRANGVHSLQRILPGEQKRKIKQTNFHWHPPSETPLSLCAVSGRKLKYQLLAGCLKSLGSHKRLVQAPRVLDDGEYISEVFLKELTWSRWIH